MTDLQKFVADRFNQIVYGSKLNSEFKRSIIDHPKTEILKKSIFQVIQDVNIHRQTKGKPQLSNKTAREVVEMYTHRFINNLAHEAEIKGLSELEKARRKAEEDHKKDLEKSVNGELSGEFLELKEEGVIMEETQTKSL